MSMPEWYHDTWSHEVRLKNGKILYPIRIDLNSGMVRGEGEYPDKRIVPALFCEILDDKGYHTLNWYSWEEVASISSKNKSA